MVHTTAASIEQIAAAAAISSRISRLAVSSGSNTATAARRWHTDTPSLALHHPHVFKLTICLGGTTSAALSTSDLTALTSVRSDDSSSSAAPPVHPAMAHALLCCGTSFLNNQARRRESLAQSDARRLPSRIRGFCARRHLPRVDATPGHAPCGRLYQTEPTIRVSLPGQARPPGGKARRPEHFHQNGELAFGCAH